MVGKGGDGKIVKKSGGGSKKFEKGVHTLDMEALEEGLREEVWL